MDATITVAITKPVSGFRCDRTTYPTKGSILDQAHLYAAPDAAVSVKDRTWQHSRQTDEASSARGGRERERKRSRASRAFKGALHSAAVIVIVRVIGRKKEEGGIQRPHFILLTNN